MAQQVKIWYDPEGDSLEVLFSDKAGYMKETDNDAVMERVDEQGKGPSWNQVLKYKIATGTICQERYGSQF